MILRNVAVHFSDEHAAVAMAHPFREGHKVNAAHHSVADEIHAQMWKPNLGTASLLPVPPQAKLAARLFDVRCWFPKLASHLSYCPQRNARGMAFAYGD